MVSKLAWHFQNIPGWAAGVVNSNWVKLIDPPVSNPFPGARTIGRTYVLDSEANALVLQGAAGAEAWYDRNVAIYERAPWVWCWEGPNEPPVQTPAERAALVAFTRRWVDLMHAAGRKTVALCLGVGWPDVGCASDLAGALEQTDYWAVHEYAAPSMRSQETWLCLRYRRMVAELQAAGARIPPLLITECGIDGGTAGRPGCGWRSFTDQAGYLNQLIWYDGELQRDAYVEAATIFTSGPAGNWVDFDVDEPLSRALAAYMQEGAPPPMPAVDPRDPNLLALHMTNGLCDGVKTIWVEQPATRFRLSYAALVPEGLAGGNTVASVQVLNVAGQAVADTPWLTWPHPTPANWAPPGNPNNQLTIVNPFDAAAGQIGPLGICLRKADGSPDSDILWGLGLPNNRHVCYKLTFQERGGEPPVPPPAAEGEYRAQLDRMEGKLDQLLANQTPIEKPVTELVGPVLRWPLVPGGVITQRFGESKEDYSQFGLVAHNGIDIGVPLGTEVCVAHAGEAWVYDDPNYGKVVEVWYPSIRKGLYKTIYAHLAAQDVPHGAVVPPGTVIGRVGSTGNSTGPHLHFGFKLLRGKNPGYRDWLDPLPFLSQA